VSAWRFVRYVAPVDGWCQRPAQMVDPSAVDLVTGLAPWILSRCRSARPSRCPYCANLHRGDVAAVGRSGWLDRPTDRGYWCTLTAPGREVLPFDLSQCHHSPGVPCAGSLGCVVEAVALAVWHDRLALAWSHFVTDLRRLLNPGLSGPPSSWPVRVEFFKTYEPQQRGALHAHEMLRVIGVVTDRRVRAAYRLAAYRNGFGRQSVCQPVDLSETIVAARCAGYCAKYAGKCSDALPDVQRISATTGEVTYGGLRAWSASRGWGDSMMSVQARRMAWAGGTGGGLRSGVPVVPDGAEGALDSYQDFYASSGGLPVLGADVVPVIV